MARICACLCAAVPDFTQKLSHYFHNLPAFTGHNRRYIP